MKMTTDTKKWSFALTQYKGFALVATISVMSLVILVALAMISLATVVTRTSGHGYHMEQARANARLALNEAVGKLQEYLGPDQRITANSEILEDINAGLTTQKYIVGAWNSLGGAGVNPLDEGQITAFNANGRDKGMKGHVGWLVPNSNLANVSSTSSPSNVQLYGDGTLYDANDHIYVNKINIGADGAYSWFVTQEATKAKLGNAGGAGHNLVSQNGQAGIHRIDGFTSYNTNGKRDLAITTQTLELINSNPQFLPDSDDNTLTAREVLKKNYFDLSANGFTLEVDVQNGGPKLDLSLMSERNKTHRFDTGELAGVVAWSEVCAYLRAYKAPNADDLDNNSGIISWAGGNGVPAGVPQISFIDSMGRFASAHHIYGLVTPKMSHWTMLVSHGVDRYGDTHVVYPVFTTDFEFWNSYSLPMHIGGERHWRFQGMGFNMGYRLRHPVHQPAWQVWGPSTDAGQPAPIMQSALGHITDDGLTATDGAGSLNGVGNTGWNKIQRVQWGRTFRSGEARKYSHINAYTDHQVVKNLFVEGWEVDGGDVGTGAFTGNLRWRYTRHPDGDGGYRYLTTGLDGVALTRNALEVGWEVQPFIKPMFLNIGKNVPYGGGGLEGATFYGGAPSAWVKSFGEIADSNFSPEDLVGALRNGPRKPFALMGMRYRAENYKEGNTAMGDLTVNPLTSTVPTTVSENLVGKRYLYGNASFDHSIGVNEATTNTDELSVFANDLANFRYEFFSKNVNDYSNGFVDITLEGNNGYMGTSHNSSDTENGFTGVNHAVMNEIPYEPVLSLAQLQHLWVWDGGKPIANSYSYPTIPTNKIKHTYGREHRDAPYILNAHLWDSYFFSGIADYTHPLVPTEWKKTHDEAIEGMIAGGAQLPNRNLSFLRQSYNGDIAAFETLLKNKSDNTAYTQLGAYMANNNSFNVNSVSVNAWIAFLSSVDDTNLIRLAARFDSTSGDSDIRKIDLNDKVSLPVSRFSLPTFDLHHNYDGLTTANKKKSKKWVQSNDFDEADSIIDKGQKEFLESRWRGVRSLTYDEIEILAHSIVHEIKQRGPFLSIADFINRRITTGDLGQKGVLQAAIDAPKVDVDGTMKDNELNASFIKTSRKTTFVDGQKVHLGDFTNDGTEEVVTLNLPNPTAAEGYVGEGAPGYIMQADLLMALAPKLTVRSDTFTVRAYGESREGNTVVASAYCEAVVQRFPDYVDSSTAPHAPFATVAANSTNNTYGRRFRVISFKWLNSEEI